MIALRLLAGAALVVGPLLLAAGRADAWGAWAWIGVVWGTAAATYSRLEKLNPALLAERLRPPSDRDRATRRLVVLPFVAHLVLSGLDLRWRWSAVPLPVQLGALATMAGGFALVRWVLLTNPFASSAVRVQPERGQSVIEAGPYRLVRHPMYLATVLVCLSSGVALGSWFSGLALLPVVAVFVRRTLLEDRMLVQELRGYVDYAARVRWRVVPFVF